MARFDISLLGDVELARSFKLLPDKIQRRVLLRALRQAANTILPIARRNAPSATGRLRRTLRVRQILRRRRGQIGIAVQTGPRTSLGIPSDARFYYPAAQELGWTPSRAKRTRPGLRRGGRIGQQRRAIRIVRSNPGGRVPPNRFLRGAYLAKEQFLIAELRRGITENIEREAFGP